MKKSVKKYVVTPLVLSSFLFVATPTVLYIEHFSNQSNTTTKNALVLDNAQSAKQNNVLSSVLSSMGLGGKVFAECSADSYGVVTCNTNGISNTCLVEGTQSAAMPTQSFNVVGGMDYYPTSFNVVVPGGELTLNPITGAPPYNNYNTGAPTDYTVNYQYKFNAPAVSVTEDPGDFSGQYSGLGRIKIPVQVQNATFYEYTGSAWTSNTRSAGTATFFINIDHQNVAPASGAPVLSYNSGTQKLTASWSISDDESHPVDAIYKLYQNNVLVQDNTSSPEALTLTPSTDGTSDTFTYEFPGTYGPGTYRFTAQGTESSYNYACADFGATDPGAGISSEVTSTIYIAASSSGTTGTTTIADNNGGSLQAGDVVTVTSSFTNNSGIPLTTLDILSAVPQYGTYVPSSLAYGTGNQATGGSFASNVSNSSGNVLTGGALANGATVVVTYQYTVNSNAPVGTAMSVLSTLSSPLLTPSVNANSSTLNVAAATTSAPSVTTVVSDDNGGAVTAGDVLTVRVTVQNTTGGPLSNVALNTVLPTTVNYVAGSLHYGTGNQATGGTFVTSPAGTTALVTGATLPAGGTLVLEYRISVASAVTSGLVLSAQTSLSSSSLGASIASNIVTVNIGSSLPNTGSQSVIPSILFSIWVLASLFFINKAKFIKRNIVEVIRRKQ